MDQSNQQSNIGSAASSVDWEVINREWRESGLTQQTFCQERGLNLSTFVYHRSRIRQRQGISKHRKFAEVKVNHQPAHSPCRDLTLHLPNNIRLSIPPSFSSEQIKAVLGALGMQVC